jgi:hypothetical protein
MTVTINGLHIGNLGDGAFHNSGTLTPATSRREIPESPDLLNLVAVLSSLSFAFADPKSAKSQQAILEEVAEEIPDLISINAEVGMILMREQGEVAQKLTKAWYG